MKISTTRSAIPTKNSDNIIRSILAIDDAINLAAATNDEELKNKFLLAMSYVKMEALRLLTGAKSRPSMEKKAEEFLMISKDYTGGSPALVASYCLDSRFRLLSLKNEIEDALPFATWILLKNGEDKERLSKLKIDEVVYLACDQISIENKEVVVEVLS